MIEVEEQRLVQKLITHPAIEALDIAVLHRLAGRDVMPLDADLAAPCEHRVRCQLGPVVADDHPRSAALLDQIAELAHNPARPDDGRVGTEWVRKCKSRGWPYP